MKTFIYSITTALIVLSGIFAVRAVLSDDDWDEHRRYSTGVERLENPLYKTECGACHMAYPPGLLPAASWLKLMGGLADHFDDNAELDLQTSAAITQFLVTYSADQSNYRRSRHFARQYDAEPVIRITELPYFIHEHDEIPNRLVAGNSAVKSFSHCNACHRRAEQGSFREREIAIPGYGRWDD